MSYIIFTYLLLCIFPLLTVSLQCYTCSAPFICNYTVTSSTNFTVTNCSLVNAKQCSISISWLEKPFQTVIKLSHTNFSIATNTLQDYVLAMALLIHTHDEKSPLVSRDKCNDELNLKKNSSFINY